ncbi:MAG: hypothetical protein WA973_21150 [Mesorhizobium sp.]
MASFPRNSLPTLLAAMLLGGCADYMNHRDTVTLGAGDAMEANLGIHTIKPFPPDAKNTNIRVDGTKLQRAHERYLLSCDQQPLVRCGDSSSSGPGISITNNMPGTEPAQ